MIETTVDEENEIHAHHKFNKWLVFRKQTSTSKEVELMKEAFTAAYALQRKKTERIWHKVSKHTDTDTFQKIMKDVIAGEDEGPQ